MNPGAAPIPPENVGGAGGRGFGQRQGLLRGQRSEGRVEKLDAIALTHQQRKPVDVGSVWVDGGRARGVVLEDGSEVEARVVLSNADPRRTFLELVDESALPDDFLAEIRRLDFRSPSLKINLALEDLPRFTGRTGAAPGPEHAGTVHVGAASLDELEASFAAAAAGALPERPMVEMTLPSSLDGSLAPPGRHVASLFVQHVPYAIEGSSWEAERDGFADRVLGLVDEVAPGFSAGVLHREVLAPPDLERIFGLAGGNLFHGAMTLDRLGFLRPLPGWARYRTPLPSLFLCGAGTHPGGGVMGACGRNAAREVLSDLGVRARRALTPLRRSPGPRS